MATISNRKLLSLAICSAIAATSQPVLAQDEEQAIEEVVVLGMRTSLENAQDMKRNADSVVDVITASDIGALPDKSVTEALQRVPGVTIERFAASDDPNHYADEGTGVLVRGLDRVRSEINGRDSFSANPYGGLNFEDIPPELLGAIEVVKSQTADRIAGGVAGTVNLITRKPLDSEEMVAGVTVKANYGDFREDWTPSFSGIFSDSWDTELGQIGFQIAGSHSDYKTRGDGVGVANFYSRGNDFIPVACPWGGVCGVDPTSPLEGPAVFGQTSDVAYLPGQFSIRTAENDRERTGLASALQWRNNEGTIETTLEYIKSEASLQYRERVIGSQEQGFVAPMGYSPSTVWDADRDVTFDANGFFTSGVISQGGDLPIHSSSRFNDTNNDIEDISLNVKLTPTDRLTVELDYQRVESTESVVNNGINARHQFDVGLAYLDLRGDTPNVEFLADGFFDPDFRMNWDGTPRDHLAFASAMDQNTDSDASSDAFKLDVEFEIDNGWARSVKAGAYYSDKTLTIRDTEYANWGAIALPWGSADQVNNAGYNAIPGEFERLDLSDFFGGGVLMGRTDFLFPAMSNAQDLTDFVRRGCADGFLNAPYGGGSYNAGGQTDDMCFLSQPDLGGRVLGPYAEHQITSTDEKRTEAYVRFDFGFDDMDVPVDGNVGLRYVKYELESTGFIVMPQPVGGAGGALFAQLYPNLATFADGTGQKQTVDGTDYSAVLPSLNLTFHLSDDMLMRFGASKSLYFPTMNNTRNSRIVDIDYTAITQDPTDPSSPVVDITDVQINGVARNPYLEPEEATNLDLTAEWYFADSGSLTMSMFHKTIDNLHRERGFIAPVTNENTGITEDVSFYGPANSGDGTIQGFELAYTQFFDMLPGAWSGLGMQFNYTYIDQNDLNDPTSDENSGDIRLDSSGNPVSNARNSFRSFSDLPLPGYSDENLNLVGMYEFEKISARLAYTWRSDYMVTRRDSNEFAPIFAEATGFMDASIYYSVNDNFKVGFEASNLLDTVTTTQAQLNQAGDRTEALNFKTDRRYALSMRYTF